MSSKRPRPAGRNGKSARGNGPTPARHTGAPPPEPAQVAEEYERLAGRHPEDREELLLEAADAWNEAGEYDSALALYERLLERGGDDAVEERDLVDAYRISTLWDAGRDEEARAAAAGFRRRHPRHAGAWTFVAEAFEAQDATATAAEWYTAGVTHVLGAGSAVTVDVVEAHVQGYDVETLLTGRHRVRRLLGEPHDDWDAVADALHERRASALLGRVRPLDELHDPLRLKRLEGHGPDMLEREIGEALDPASSENHAVRAGPRATCVLYWPRDELSGLLERWPKAAEAYGDDHAGHLRQVERTLRDLSEEGATQLAVGRATVRGVEAYAATNGGSPDFPGTRSAYAAELVRTGRAEAWPPPRNGPCWCASGRKYKKCCGNPALT
ncbi:tetratricopeptide repeat protein [Streptomyces montanus]|uniref:Tetratricopeptide repeat protein n=1 Tax=Streptomyces montanus TaxID=2580423 RepID=A0A5R9FCH1_9ACTN|nr:SEC-C domain-containing protein [Streptomyces montanus]TLS41422.1 tetratricopeptide repeat protein [Streptomyces montanus]